MSFRWQFNLSNGSHDLDFLFFFKIYIHLLLKPFGLQVIHQENHTVLMKVPAILTLQGWKKVLGHLIPSRCTELHSENSRQSPSAVPNTSVIHAFCARDWEGQCISNIAEETVFLFLYF